MTLAQGDAIRGDTQGDSPAAAETDSELEAAALDDKDPEPVVVAKDGKHTIPYEELQAAREQARYWQAKAEEAQAAAESRQQQAEAPPDSSVDLKALRKELREAFLLDDEARVEELEAQIDEEIARRAEVAVVNVLTRRAAEAEAAAQAREVEAVAAELIKEYPFLDHTKSTANDEAISMVQAISAMYASQGMPAVGALTSAVDKVVKLFGQEAMPSGRAGALSDAEARAAAVIAGAKSKVPSSMSSIPAAAAPPADEAQALAAMSPQAVQDRMMEMPRDKIMELLTRTM